jgi:hypothetical protein
MFLIRCAAFLGLTLASWPQNSSRGLASNGPSPKDLGARVHLSVGTIRDQSVDFDFEVLNSGAESIYIVTDTKRSNGSEGPYISVKEHDPSTLQLQVQLFGPPKYNLYQNGAGARLKLVRSGEKYLQHFSLQRPFVFTEPPYDLTKRGTTIPDRSLAHVQLVVGVLLATAEIQRLMDPTTGSQGVNGLEPMTRAESPTRLYQAQVIVYSPAIPLSLNGMTSSTRTER